MARSVLLQLARDSIQEVFEAKRNINIKDLTDEHPLLKESITASVKIYLANELRGFSYLKDQGKSLIENIVLNAKKAAFEDKNFQPLSTSEYLACEIEIELTTPDGVMSERDPAILKTTEYSLQKELED